MNQFYFFSNDHFQHPNIVDETLRKVTILSLFPFGFVVSRANAPVSPWMSS